MDKEMLEALGRMLEPVKGQMDKIIIHMDNEFAQVKERMDHMEEGMKQMDSRLNHMTASMKLMESRMEKMEGRMGRMEDDIAILREDCDITRAAANELIDWTGEINQAVGFPLPKLGEKIS